MKLSYVRLCGFRGYSSSLEIEFAPTFTVIDGRNGVGKSSIFDAVEFALLGSMTKYGTVSSDGETVDDYIWWRGQGSSPTERFVEVGFELDGEILPIRRTMLKGPDPAHFKRVVASLLSTTHAPDAALRQLCASAIIRDEQIAELSLDLRETERFKRLRDALGASDADVWIRRASRIHDLSKARREVAERDVYQAATASNALSAQIEETRRSIPDRAVVDEATTRLRSFSGEVGTSTSTDVFRSAIAAQQAAVTDLVALEDEWLQVLAAQESLIETDAELAMVASNIEEATRALEDLSARVLAGHSSSDKKRVAEAYASLVTSGTEVGLQDGHCPLCAADRTEDDFERGLGIAREAVTRLDEEALARAELEGSLHAARIKKQQFDTELVRLQSLRTSSNRRIAEFTQKLASAGLPEESQLRQIQELRSTREIGLEQARRDFAVVDSLRLTASLDTQLSSLASGQLRRQSAEEKLGIARQAEVRAKAIYDAARRASGEVLSKRLDLVMPLMSEFYRRLRPHPVWEDIDYKLRGDVQKALRLKIGDDLNPQFIYSSGQRRATGLAFLLAVNLSLSWNNWKTLMLDDPVQHIDDFRSVHLAEVLAKILGSGRQVICAAEDEALADLIVRHLPVHSGIQGKRITMGVDASGALAKTRDTIVSPMPQNVFAVAPPEQSVV